MLENLVLAFFALLPPFCGLLLYRYFTAKPAAFARRPRLDLVAGNGLVLLLLLSFVLVAAEIYYRFIYDTTDAFGLARVTRDWMMKHEQMNRFGFRDSVEYQIDRPPGTRRVTFIGDSFTAGHGVPDVEDRFANRIRRMHPDRDVQVLATNGFDTGQELALVKQLAGARYPFDLVVLVYCLNDIADIVPEWKRISEKIYARPRPPVLIEHSYFLNTWYYRLRSARDPEIKQYYSFVIDAYQGPLWAAQKERLATMAELVRAGGGRFLVVVFPFLHRIGAGYEYGAVHEQIGRFCAEIEAPHLDLLGIYSEERSRDLIVNPRDPHPNEHAHALAADAISAFIAEKEAR